MRRLHASGSFAPFTKAAANTWTNWIMLQQVPRRATLCCDALSLRPGSGTVSQPSEKPLHRPAIN
jgi:hypothetical protein